MSQGDDPKSKLSKSLHEVRSSSRPAMKAVRPGEPEQSISPMMEKLVDLLISSTETNVQLVEKVEESMAEDKRVRHELTQARLGYRRMRVAVYTMCAVFAFGTAFFSYVLIDSRLTVRTMDKTMAAVDENTSKMMRILVKQAETHAKSVEAEVRLTPQADEEALKSAIDLQKEAAKAQIEVAQKRHEATPPGAHEALQKAVAKEKALRGDGASALE